MTMFCQAAVTRLFSGKVPVTFMPSAITEGFNRENIMVALMLHQCGVFVPVINL